MALLLRTISSLVTCLFLCVTRSLSVPFKMIAAKKKNEFSKPLEMFIFTCQLNIFF